MKEKIFMFAKKFFKFCFSIKMSIILLVIYGFLCAIATFIENDFGVQDAKNLIYNTTFFDIVHILLAINLIGVFCYFKPWKRKKYASMLLHLSFIVILIGAGVTRYFGFEGYMHIRQGDNSDIVITQDEHIIVIGSIDGKVYKTHFPIHISGVSDYAQLYNAYLPAPLATIFSFALNKQIPFAFEEKTIPFGDSYVKVKYKEYQPAQMMLVPQPMLKLEVSYKGESKEIVLVQNYVDDTLEPFILGDAEFALSWGPNPIKLPFALHLNKFEMQKYPGSSSPSSYASEVVIQDSQNNVHKPYRIFMNNVLDYGGFRFFQSSYDEDEKGTILSVNKDPGKIITYIGYAMLITCFVWNLFARNGRFYGLWQYLKKQQIFGFILFFAIFNAQNLYSQNIEQTAQDTFILDRINSLAKNAKAHSKKFGTIIVQDFEGRNKPLDTLAMDLVHKITKKNKMFGLNHTELFLAMVLYYDEFRNVKIIATSTPRLREVIGVPKNQRYIAINDAYEDNMYKLSNYIEEANRKEPSKRDAFDKDVLSVNERINLAFAILSADILRIFPDPHNSSNWFSPADAVTTFSHEDASMIEKAVESYFTSIDEVLADNSNDWSKANANLNKLKEIQHKYGSAFIPSNTKISAEILLNHLDIFNKLTYIYLVLGFILFVLVFVSILQNKPLNISITRLFSAIILLNVVIHTIGLALRWYVGGHAPWSNAYESMIYIAWASGIAAVVFRKSLLAQSMAILVAGITLFVANLGFMDPQIGNLVPVLKSYWLNIHVSVITASYGFFGLCFIAGFVSLLLFILRSPKRLAIDTTILNIHCINEISMIVGLTLLTIGNFLGGVWANESWGRYWGWDPKETWALVSIIVYAIVLHVRFIQKLNTPFVFATLSIIAFYSILMTYFGVNFYLSGKHSYATGDSAPIPIFLYVMTGICIALIIGAFFKRKLQAPKI